MKKSEYLDKLNYEIGNMSAEQKEDILSIFSEHFEQGLLEGKSEEDICQGLGSPAYVAAQFIENNRGVLQNAIENKPAEAPEKAPVLRQTQGNEPGKATGESKSYRGEGDINRSFSPQGLSGINIKVLTADITIFSDDEGNRGENLWVSITGFSRNSRFDVNASGGVLNIIEDRKFSLSTLFNMMISCKIEVYVPKSFTGNLFLKDSAGNVNLTGLKLGAAELRASAGDIRITRHVGDIEIHSTAGSSYLTDIHGGLELFSTAGDIKIDQCDGDIKVQATAGDIKIKNSRGDVSAKSSAGNIKVTAEEISALTASSSAGNVKVETKRLSGNAELSTSAGNVSLETREVAGSVSVKSSFGNATVALPRNASMKILSLKAVGMLKNEFVSNPDSPYVLDISSSFGAVKIKCVD